MEDLFLIALELWQLIPRGYLWAAAGSVAMELVTMANYSFRNAGRFPPRYSRLSYCLFRVVFHLFVPGLVALAFLPVAYSPHDPPSRAFFLVGLAAPILISRLRNGGE
jgi:hypothetical protein